MRINNKNRIYKLFYLPFPKVKLERNRNVAVGIRFKYLIGIVWFLFLSFLILKDCFTFGIWKLFYLPFSK